MNYNFPSEFVKIEDKKKADYGIAYFKAAWNYYGGWGRFDDRQLLIRELRRWAMGLQSIDNMKPYFTAERADTTYVNLDWSAPAIVATYRDRIVQRIANIPYDLTARAVDPLSVSKRMDYEAELKAKVKLKPENEYFKEQFGVGIYDDEKLPEDEEQISVFMDLEYKLSSEIAMSAAMEWLFYLSGDKDLKMRCIKDFVDIGRSFLKVTYDDKRRPILKYVDPARFITNYSEKEDYSDLIFGFELKFKTIMEIKKECPDMTEAQLRIIGEANMTKFGNNGTSKDFRYFPTTPFYYPQYYNYKVAVLEGDFLTLKYEGLDVYENYMGRTKVINPANKTPKKDKKKTTVDLEAQTVFTGVWVVETDVIYNYGEAKDILRWRNDGELSLSTRLPYFGYQPDMREMQNKGLVERMRPHAEQMHLAILKVQQELAAAAPSGHEIDIGNLAGIMLGKGKGVGNDNATSPMELIKIHKQTGNLFVNKSKNGGTSQGQGATATPITGVNLNTIQAHILTFDFHKGMLLDVIGGAGVANTGTPSADALVGVQKMAAVAADNSLGVTIHSYMTLMENAAKLLCMYTQNVVEHGDMEVFQRGIGDEFTRAIKLTKQVAMCDYAIKIRFMPTQEEKLVLQSYVQSALKAGRIDFSTAYLLETQMNNPMMAWAYLKRAEADTEKKAQQKALELSQANAQANAQAGQAVEQAKQQTEQLKAEAKMAEIAAQGEVDETLLEKEYQLKYGQVAVQGNEDRQLATVMNSQRTFQNSDMLK